MERFFENVDVLRRKGWAARFSEAKLANPSGNGSPDAWVGSNKKQCSGFFFSVTSLANQDVRR